MLGSMQIEVRDGDEAPAQPSGVRIGMRRDRPVTLRLFRPQGTRIAVLASAVPAQLVAMRAAAIGATVRVQSPRPQAWGAVVRHGVDVSVAPPGHDGSVRCCSGSLTCISTAVETTRSNCSGAGPRSRAA